MKIIIAKLHNILSFPDDKILQKTSVISTRCFVRYIKLQSPRTYQNRNTTKKMPKISRNIRIFSLDRKNNILLSVCFLRVNTNGKYFLSTKSPHSVDIRKRSRFQCPQCNNKIELLKSPVHSGYIQSKGVIFHHRKIAVSCSFFVFSLSGWV